MGGRNEGLSLSCRVRRYVSCLLMCSRRNNFVHMIDVGFGVICVKSNERRKVVSKVLDKRCTSFEVVEVLYMFVSSV